MTYLILVAYLAVVTATLAMLMKIIGFGLPFLILTFAITMGFEFKVGESFEIQLNGVIPEVKKFLVASKEIDAKNKELKEERRKLNELLKEGR